jgi:hypothetical protein
MIDGANEEGYNGNKGKEDINSQQRKSVYGAIAG